METPPEQSLGGEEILMRWLFGTGHTLTVETVPLKPGSHLCHIGQVRGPRGRKVRATAGTLRLRPVRTSYDLSSLFGPAYLPCCCRSIGSHVMGVGPWLSYDRSSVRCSPQAYRKHNANSFVRHI